MSELIELEKTRIPKTLQKILIALTETAFLDSKENARKDAQNLISQLTDEYVTGGFCIDNQMFLRLVDTNSIYVADVPKKYQGLPQKPVEFNIPQ